jgi:hypothetical protein
MKGNVMMSWTTAPQYAVYKSVFMTNTINATNVKARRSVFSITFEVGINQMSILI